MTVYISRLGFVGHARETTAYTYLAPTRHSACKGLQFEDVIMPLVDDSMRNNDTVVQGVYAGPADSTGTYSVEDAYPDVLGDYLRAIIGPDTVTAGTATTLSATTTAGATSITSAASIASGSTISIGTGATLEYAVTGAPTGAGPYTLPITAPSGGLLYGHTSGVAIQKISSHAFAQGTGASRMATYSLTTWNGVEQRGFPGMVLEELDIKIDPKGKISLTPKWHGFPSATQSGDTAGYGTVAPFVGWMWTQTIGGAASTRGITCDITIKRAVEAISSSDGTQAPREMVSGGIEVDFKTKAIFENNLDWTTFLNKTQGALVNTFTAPTAIGGCVAAITSSKVDFSTFKPDFSGDYVMVDIDQKAIYNATDAGALTATLTNYLTTAY